MKTMLCRPCLHLPFLAALGWLLATASAAGIAGAEPGSGPGSGESETFLTNLGLLDRLTGDAVDQILDSLDVRPGEEITVLPAGHSDASDFVSDAFARALARRRCQVRRMAPVTAAAPVVETPAEAEKPAGEEAPPPEETPWNPFAEPAPGDTTAVNPDSLGAQPDGSSLDSGDTCLLYTSP
ncbi:MAG: hypothetical protein QUU85_03730, partial [Candidatus Eisenbacteria bacterium]|nr:hypothetical protein [Candidatus Eisenbacteria bacterium]